MRRTTRFGQSVEVDEVFEAWTSRDIERMVAALNLPTNAVDRHHLLQALAGELYRLRANPVLGELFHDVARLHLEEMPVLLRELQRDRVAGRAALRRHAEERAARRGEVAQPVAHGSHDGTPWLLISTFEQLDRYYRERSAFAEARAVWRRAREIGYLEVKACDARLERIDRAERKASVRPMPGA